MKILVLSNLYPPFVIGGYELNCRNVCEELRARGHEVTVLTTANHIPHTAEGDHVLRRLNTTAFMPKFAISDRYPHHQMDRDVSNYLNTMILLDTLRDTKPDVVFFWNLHGLGGLHLIDLVQTIGIPWAFYLGDRVYEQMLNSAPLHVLQVFRGHDQAHFAAGLNLVVSQQLADEIQRMGRFRFDPPPQLIYGYAHLASGYEDHDYQQHGVTRFVFAGRISDHKGVQLIVEAAAKLSGDCRGKFEVHMFGDGEIHQYRNQTQILAIEDIVTFHGPVSQSILHQIYKTHDVFLFPTWEREPFAFAPFEAAALGCVPILTDTCGCAERLVDGVHCLKVVRETDSLAEAMRSVIDGDVNLLDIGRASSALVREDLSFSGNVDLMEHGLSRIAKGWREEELFRPEMGLLIFMKHHVALAMYLEEVG